MKQTVRNRCWYSFGVSSLNGSVSFPPGVGIVRLIEALSRLRWHIDLRVELNVYFCETWFNIHVKDIELLTEEKLVSIGYSLMMFLKCHLLPFGSSKSNCLYWFENWNQINNEGIVKRRETLWINLVATSLLNRYVLKCSTPSAGILLLRRCPRGHCVLCFWEHYTWTTEALTNWNI